MGPAFGALVGELFEERSAKLPNYLLVRLLFWLYLKMMLGRKTMGVLCLRKF